MRKLHELTNFQKTFAENHIGLVFKYLHHSGLSENEYYDVVIFGYLLAVQEYDEHPELEKYQFSTIAYTRMHSCLCDHYTYLNRQKRKAPTKSLQDCSENGLTLDELLPDRKKCLLNQTSDRLYAMEVFSYLTETEQQMVKLKAAGMTNRDLATIFGVTINTIAHRFHRMRARLVQLQIYA